MGGGAAGAPLIQAFHCSGYRGSGLSSGQGRPPLSPGSLRAGKQFLVTRLTPHYNQGPGASGHSSLPRPSSPVAPRRPFLRQKTWEGAGS